MGYAGVIGEFDDAVVAVRLREEIARQRISRAGLAQSARLSVSTLEKALSGRRRFTLATIVRLEEALGASLRGSAVAEPELAVASPMLAPAEMGSYSRPAVRWIEGEYLTLRASFGEDGAVYAYRTDIRWDDAKGHLIFSESDRLDATFEQGGFVSMPHLSGHTYLMTSEAGQYRMIMLGRATREQRMFGLLSTLQVGKGSQLVPVSCPVAFVPLEEVVDPVFGLVSEGHARLEEYRVVLNMAMGDDFCRLRE
ncbi:helix-turn-helix transcriptional regulator [uncultured Erythrobacter sp.]|uniref:helix-turn-helix domain-containing protein n=1 Tax=uncultured Erythrobacter sp. TaxID=263913 RepID=UPI002627EB53|nr:helix-turn-helix transcriptional regulator [uncultured Erythrobacter sp.]